MMRIYGAFLLLLLAVLPLRAQVANFHFETLPAPLQKVHGVHPRLYLNDKRVLELRQAVKTTHAALWPEIQAQADKFAAGGPPPNRAEPDGSGEEQLWQRTVGNAMPPLALAFVLTGDQKYLNGARAWALASCSYPTWGLGKN